MTPAQCRAARALLDWPQQDLAIAAGISVVTIRQFEAGAVAPRRATMEALMTTLVTAGIQFLEGGGAGPGVRFRHEACTLEQFNEFLEQYEQQHLGQKARSSTPLPLFGYAFVRREQAAVELQFRGKRLGEVRWREGSVLFTPPLFPGVDPKLSKEVFDAWVARAEYYAATGT